MPVQTLMDFLTNQKDTVARKSASEIRKLGPAYRKVPVKELRHRVSIVLSSLENSLTRCDLKEWRSSFEDYSVKLVGLLRNETKERCNG